MENGYFVELSPIDRHKSFYGKARAIRNGDTWYCMSYNTLVASYNTATGYIVRHWSGYSVTTTRHVNAFLAFLGFPYGGKAFWQSLPTGEAVKLG